MTGASFVPAEDRRRPSALWLWSGPEASRALRTRDLASRPRGRPTDVERAPGTSHSTAAPKPKRVAPVPHQIPAASRGLTATSAVPRAASLSAASQSSRHCRATLASPPFIGLAEAHALAAIRGASVPLQRIRPALDRLSEELRIEHVLASPALYTDGAEVLYDFAERSGDTPEARSARELVVVRNNQHVFTDIVDSYLRRVDFAADGWAERTHLPKYGRATSSSIHGARSAHPIFARGAVRLETVLAAFTAGTDIEGHTSEYGVPRDDLLSVLRAHTEAA